MVHWFDLQVVPSNLDSHRSRVRDRKLESGISCAVDSVRAVALLDHLLLQIMEVNLISVRP